MAQCTSLVKETTKWLADQVDKFCSDNDNLLKTVFMTKPKKTVVIQLERYSNFKKHVDAMSHIQPASNWTPAIHISRIDQKNEKTVNFRLLQVEQFVKRMKSLKILKNSAKLKNFWSYFASCLKIKDFFAPKSQ